MRFKIAVLIFCLLLPGLLSAYWEYTTSMSTAREGLCLVELNGSLYAIGGKNGNVTLSTIEVYNIATEEWSEGPSINHARAFAAAAVHDGRIFLFGGREGINYVSTIEVFDYNTGIWTDLAEPVVFERTGMTAVTLGDSIIVVGGFNLNATYSNAVKVFDPVASQWRDNLSDLPSPRAAHGTAVINGAVLVAGGFFYNLTDDLMIMEDNTWSTELAQMPVALGNLAAASLDDSLIICGGMDDVGTCSTAFKYTVESDIWVSIEPMHETRESHGMVSYGDRIYVAGGSHEGEVLQEYLSSVEIYIPGLVGIVGERAAGEVDNYTITVHPNPMTYNTNIGIFLHSLPTDGLIPITVFDILGREVMSWEKSVHTDGPLNLVWSGQDRSGNPVPSGIYFVRIQGATSTTTHKVIINR